MADHALTPPSLTAVPDLYRAARARLLALADELEPAEARLPVPACPRWVVKDVYAHLTGVVADVMAGRTDGVATDPWTAKQVEARRESSFADVCAEWASIGPPFEQALDAMAGAVDPRLIFDVWTHEQDVRGAVGRPGAREGDAVQFCLAGLLSWMDERLRSDRAPALRIAGSTGAWTVGDGEPVATISGTDFELVRAFIGRRSMRQLTAMAGGARDAVADLTIFTPPADDLVE